MTPWVVSLAGIAASLVLLGVVFHLIRSRCLNTITVASTSG